MWVHAMYSYSQVSKIVEPKRVQLRESEAELAVVTEQLNAALAELKTVEDRLGELDANYKAGVARSEALVNDVEMCKTKLVRAEKLIGLLGGEKARWAVTVEELTKAYELIIGDVLVSSGTIAYVGAFTATFRQQLYEDWRKKLTTLNIGHTEGCNIRQTMADPVQIRSWQIAGLPTDSLSTENGIIIAKARRWPLLIDPQGQAGKFIKNLGAQKFEEGLTVLKLTDKNFLQSLESAIRFGKWVLLERVLEELDPSLEPLLQQQLVNVNGSPHVKLGENMVPYSDQFHFYICTSLPNPHYAPELQVKVTLLNFTITPEGLEDQMLGTVVAKEMPEMEMKKNNLMVQNAKMKKQLQEIADQILKLLSESTGDILEDETLINVLAESKATSTEINQKVLEAEVIEKEIDVTRKGYIPVAFRASLLYFCIADLSLIDPMYQYSLEWFVALFIQGIANCQPSDVLEERLTSLNDYFTYSLYENICRSLFEKHKLLFSFLLCIKILQGNGKVDASEWRFLVAGGAPKKAIANPSTWMTENVWGSVVALSDLPSFAGLEKSFQDNLEAWETFYESANPQTEPLPAGWAEKLDPLQFLMLLRSIRPDKMAPALQNYVGISMGPTYTEFPQFDLGLSFKASTNVSPIIFILSPGADPTNALLKFAEEQGYSSTMNMISLGQGQGPKAQKFIEDGIKKGGWVLLQNCHLAVSWLPTLEKIVVNMKPEEVNEDFRLWLTSAPTPKFPVSVLQNGVKLTKEPSKGLRANLMQSYYSFSDNYLDTTTKPDVFKKLLYGMCFFHAVVLERRKYGPLGWNIPYAFAESDLMVCLTQLGDFIDMYDEVPYDVVHFLSYDVNYGGRVTDDNDRRTIRIILDEYMHGGVLEDTCKFSESGKYMSPPVGNRQYYLDTISELPAESDPEVFGMHSNADITSAQQATLELFSTILMLLPKSSVGAGKNREDIIDELAVGILNTMPAEWDIDTVGKKYPTLYSESMNTVLLQEIIRYNRLLATMRKSLVDICKALKGEMVLSADPIQYHSNTILRPF
jgi:dynein heavy chain